MTPRRKTVAVYVAVYAAVFGLLGGGIAYVVSRPVKSIEEPATEEEP